MERILSDPGQQVAPNVMNRVPTRTIRAEQEESEALKQAAKLFPELPKPILTASPACRPGGAVMQAPAVGEQEALQKVGKQLARNHHDVPCPPFCADKIAVK